MNYFIKNIRINKLLHLQDFNIPIANENAPHLMQMEPAKQFC